MATLDHVAYRPRDIANCVGAYLREANLEGIVSMFHPECKIFFPPDQAPLCGHDGVRIAFESFLGARPNLQSSTISEVIVGDIAMLRANWSIASQDGIVIAEGQSTEVAVRLSSGGWGYLIDCPNGLPVLEN